MSFIAPTIATFKTYFSRDFPYGTDDETVQDSDIQKALDQAGFNFNSELFGTQADYELVYLWLTAHYLVIDFRASTAGLAGKFSWLEQSKSVGSVSQSFGIPQDVLNSPEFSMYTTTNYGAKFLSLMLPRLKGQIFAVCGRTHA